MHGTYQQPHKNYPLAGEINSRPMRMLQQQGFEHVNQKEACGAIARWAITPS